MGSIPTRENIYLHLYFHFFAVVSRQSAASSATQHAMPPELGERSVLTLGYPAVIQCEADLIIFLKKQREKTNTL